MLLKKIAVIHWQARAITESLPDEKLSSDGPMHGCPDQICCMRQQVYDCIPRPKLWSVLMEHRFSGLFLKAIKSLYIHSWAL